MLICAVSRTHLTQSGGQQRYFCPLVVHRKIAPEIFDLHKAFFVVTFFPACHQNALWNESCLTLFKEEMKGNVNRRFADRDYNRVTNTYERWKIEF